MNIITQYKEFLNSFPKSSLLESISTGFNTIVESELFGEESPHHKITIAYEIITPESSVDGDAAERGWEDEDGIDIEPDFDRTDPDFQEKYYESYKKELVNDTIRFLRDISGISEASSSVFVNNVWYTTYGEQNPQDGSYKNYSYFLKNYTQDESKAVYDELKRMRVI